MARTAGPRASKGRPPCASPVAPRVPPPAHAGLGVTTALTAPAASAAPATTASAATAPSRLHHHHHKLGTKSLVAVLLADTNGFDTNGKDFDILTAAVKAVLKAKPTPRWASWPMGRCR